MSEENICTTCGGIISISYTMTFENCTPASMGQAPYPFPANKRLCQGHHDQIDITLTDMLLRGLYAEGSHHKQYALCEIAKLLGLAHVLEEVEDRGKA